MVVHIISILCILQFSKILGKSYTLYEFYSECNWYGNWYWFFHFLFSIWYDYAIKAFNILHDYANKTYFKYPLFFPFRQIDVTNLLVSTEIKSYFFINFIMFLYSDQRIFLRNDKKEPNFAQKNTQRLIILSCTSIYLRVPGIYYANAFDTSIVQKKSMIIFKFWHICNMINQIFVSLK